MKTEKKHYAYDAPGFLEAPDGNYFDTQPFRDYVGLVKTAITASLSVFPDGRLKGSTLSEIHRSLGQSAKPEWTLDAFFWIDNLVHEGSPVRYRILNRPIKTATLHKSMWTVSAKNFSPKK